MYLKGMTKGLEARLCHSNIKDMKDMKDMKDIPKLAP